MEHAEPKCVPSTNGGEGPDLRSIREAVTSSVERAVLQLCGGTVIGAAAPPGRTRPVEARSSSSPESIRDAISASISFPNCSNGKEDSPDIRGKPHDVEVRIALTLFHRWRRMTASSSSSSVLTVTSDLGLAREVSTPWQLAELLRPLVEDDVREGVGDDARPGLRRGRPPPPMSPDVRTRPSGVLAMMTWDRARALRKAGRRPCPLCDQWCRGERGLWWHQQRYHGADHSEAAASAAATSDVDAIVPYVRGPARGDGRSRGNGGNDGDDGVSGRSDAAGTTGTTTMCRGGHDGDDTNDDAETSARPWLAPHVDADPLDCVKGGDLGGLQRAVSLGTYTPFASFDAKGATPLMWAAGAGHLTVVRYLMEECGCDPHQPQRGRRSFAGRTALHWASRNGHLDVVRYLLEPSPAFRGDLAGALLEAATQDGTTAFGWACWQRHLDVMEYLHRRGCNIHAVNSFGCNAVLWCAQGNSDVGPSDGSSRNSEGHPASSTGLRALQWLRGRGCDVELVNHNGHGVLHKAAQRGLRDVAEWFVTHLEAVRDGVSPTCRDGTPPPSPPLALIGPDAEGCCPSDLAGMEGHEDLARWLAAAEVKLCMRWGCVPHFEVPRAVEISMAGASGANCCHLWERYGGLRRMRWAMTGKKDC